MTEGKAALILECEKRKYDPKPPTVYPDSEAGVVHERKAPDWAADSSPVEKRTNGTRNYDDTV